MSVVRHLMATLFRTLLGVILALVVGGAVGAGLTLAVAYSQSAQPWPPQGLTTLAATAIGVLTALLSASFVLMRAAIHGLLKTGKMALAEATGPVGIAAEAFKLAEHIEGH